jgi:hypothetical protein
VRSFFQRCRQILGPLLTARSGAPFLTGLTGKGYIEKLWNEILEDTIKVNPELKGNISLT